MKEEAPEYAGASAATIPTGTAVGWHRATPALRARRQQLGLRLVDVAELTSIALSRISNYERGENLAPAAAAAALAAALDGRVDALFGPRMLRSSEAQRVKGLGDAHTVTRAIARHELSIAEENPYYRYVWAHEVEAWTPRPRGGQRRLEPIKCDRNGCDVVFRPHDAKDRLCSPECRDLDREAREAVFLADAINAFELLDTAAMGKAIRRSRRRVLNLVDRGQLRAVRVVGFGGLGILLFPRSEVERFERDCLARAKDGRQRAWLEPRVVTGRTYLVRAIASRSGLDETAARAVLEEEVKARRRVLRFNAGAPSKNEIRELVLAAGSRVAYRHARDGVEESYTKFCADVGQELWHEQYRGGLDWFPAEWAAANDPESYAIEYRSNVTARVRGLGGEELKALHIAGRKSRAS